MHGALCPPKRPAGAAAAEEPVGGELRVRVESGISDGGRAYVARGQRVTVRGSVSEFAPRQYVDTSSGTRATPTVRGSFRFYRKQPGLNSKRMLHSNYFIRGYAIHGYHSVPTHLASHGWLRVPIANARSIDRWIDLGDRIDVYR